MFRKLIDVTLCVLSAAFSVMIVFANTSTYQCLIHSSSNDDQKTQQQLLYNKYSFTGQTGFGAYSAHVADGGHAFVLQAPHIGMSNDLELGKYSRDGQDHAGSACGAAVGAMCHCMAGNPMPDLATATADWQMNFLIQEIGKRMPALNACAEGNEKQAELARQTHQIGKDMLEQCLSTEFGDANSMLFVMTGIPVSYTHLTLPTTPYV